MPRLAAVSEVPAVRLWRLAVLFPVGVWAGCGDALLPSDYIGPPAAELTGNVLVDDRLAILDADRPRLHVEWLTSLAEGGADRPELRTPTLRGQEVSFQRSQQLRSDWDIGLSVPIDAVKLAMDVDMRPLTMAIGKMVYFDDRVADGQLDWGCRGGDCDRVMAISNEFIVYVERPLLCSPTTSKTTGKAPQQRLSAGYHYFVLDGNQPIEIGAGGALNFLVEDSSPADSDPTTALRSFTSLLLFSMRLDALEGC